MEPLAPGGGLRVNESLTVDGTVVADTSEGERAPTSAREGIWRVGEVIWGPWGELPIRDWRRASSSSFSSGF
jgi:hypothetical protein